MIDVFISYSREDEDKAKLLAGTLESHEWHVWWDHKINPGKSFESEIQHALSSAKCVVVLWSRNSIASDWVKDEADEGKKLGRLVSARLDDSTVPLGFRQQQVANLSDWNGQESHFEYKKLVAGIAEHLSKNDNNNQARIETPDIIRDWSAELMARGYGFRKIQVHLTDEDHVIEVRVLYKWKVPIIVNIDDKAVASTYRDVDTRLMRLTFDIGDGSITHAGMVEVHTGGFDQITKCVLRIGKTELISV